MNSNNYSEAFEFVIGTLRGADRSQFLHRLSGDITLQQEVHFWEDNLLVLNASGEEVLPYAATWTTIEKNIRQSKDKLSVTKPRAPWFAWPSAVLGGLFIIIVLTLTLMLRAPSGVNADYVAVLTDSDGVAKLTAITEQGGKTLWLQWGDEEIPEDSSLQLWAISQRDGQVRSLAIFEDGKPGQLILNETNLRLIRDSSHLVLTEEESGGSSIDEPSDMVIAKGECVRLNNPS